MTLKFNPLVPQKIDYYESDQSSDLAVHNALQLLSSSLSPPVMQMNTEVFTETGTANSSFTSNSSTYSGWGAPIGPQRFNRVQFYVQAWSSGSPITEVRVRIKQTNTSGTLLGDTTVGVTFVDTSSFILVTADFGTIIGDGTTQLWMEYLANGKTGILGLTTIPYPSPTYPDTKYVSVSALTGTFSNNYGSQIIPYARFSISSATNVTETSSSNGVDFNNTQSHLTSTFSAWGSPVGVVRNFDTAEVDVQAFDVAFLPTQIRVIIRKTDSTGNILSDTGTITLSSPITYNVGYRLTVTLPNKVVNAAGDSLWAEIYTNGRIGIRALSSVVFATSSGYPRARYNTSGSLTAGLGTTASGDENHYWRFSTADVSQTRLVSVSDTQKALANTVNTALFKPAIQLPATLYAVVGRQMDLYFDNTYWMPTTSDMSNQIALDVVYNNAPTASGSGAQYATRWSYTPVIGEIGTTPLALNATVNGQALASWSGSLVVKGVATSGGVSRKILMIGDSTTAGGQVLSELYNLFVGDGSMSISYIGTRGGIANTGGLTASGTTATLVATTNHGLTTGDTETIYGAVDAKYNITTTVTVTNPTTFTYTIAAGATSPDTAAAGEITFASQGVSDSSSTTRKVRHEAISGTNVTYWYNNSGNSITNRLLSAGTFNFSNYLSTYSFTMSSSDWVIFHLGINDMFSLTTDASCVSKIQTIKAYIDAMITSIKAAVSGIRIGICLVTPSTKKAFGNVYGSGQTWERYKRNLGYFQDMVLRSYDGVQSNVYVIPYGPFLDAYNNFSTTNIAVNARNATTEAICNNAVHPANSGYYQMADALHWFLKGQET